MALTEAGKLDPDMVAAEETATALERLRERIRFASPTSCFDSSINDSHA
jgi:hypothetical protein